MKSIELIPMPTTDLADFINFVIKDHAYLLKKSGCCATYQQAETTTRTAVLSHFRVNVKSCVSIHRKSQAALLS